jgi:hypothetical protein
VRRQLGYQVLCGTRHPTTLEHWFPQELWSSGIRRQADIGYRGMSGRRKRRAAVGRSHDYRSAVRFGQRPGRGLMEPLRHLTHLPTCPSIGVHSAESGGLEPPGVTHDPLSRRSRCACPVHSPRSAATERWVPRGKWPPIVAMAGFEPATSPFGGGRAVLLRHIASVALAGLEPAASRLGGGRSVH